MIKNSILILFLFLTQIIVSQEENLYFDNVDIGKLYSNEITYSSCIDSFGNLWVGTESGLLRYDGLSYETFVNDPEDPSSISSNIISFVFTDSKSNVWVGTKTGGLNKYVEGGFEHFFRKEDLPKDFKNTWVRDIIENDDGSFWIAMDGAGLTLFYPESGEYKNFKHDSTNNRSICNNAVTSLLKTSNGSLFIGTFRGFCELEDQEKGTFIRYSHELNPHSNSVMDIVEDGNNDIWIGSWQGGLSKVDTEKKICIPNKNFDLKYSIVCLNTFDEKTLLIGSWGDGVVQYNTVSNDVVIIDEVEAKAKGMKGTGIRNIYKDKSDVFWISSNNGIFKLDKHKRKFYDNMFEENIVVDGNIPEIKHFAELNNVEIIVGTEKGVRVYNHQTNTFNTRIESLLNKTLKDYMINKVIVENGKIYLATRENGVYIFNKTNYNITRHLNSDIIIQDGKVFHNFISDIIVEDSLVYIASRSLIEYNSQNNEMSVLFELDNQFATKLLKDSKENIWVGAFTAGLYKFSLKSNKVENYINQENNINSIPGNTIHDIYEDKENNLWVASENGLCTYNYDKNSFDRVIVDPEAKNVSVMAISETKDNKLWVSTEKDLALFNKNVGMFSIYDMSNGLPDIDFVYGSSIYSSTGELYFGTQTGFLHFNPDSLWFKKASPRLIVEGIYMNCDTKIRSTKNGIVKIKKGADYCIKTKVLDFTNPLRNRYLYKLEGIDTSWHDNAFDPILKGIDLPLGYYSISFKGANSDNVFSTNQAIVRIKIVSPIISLWWLYICVILISVITFYYLKIKGGQQSKYAKSSLTDEAMNEYVKKLKSYMQSEKPFLKDDVYLKEVADKLEINQNYLSQSINDVLKKNFFDFVNEYRIEEAKKLLSDEKYNNMNLLGIGYESGFNSKTSFYTIFKKHTGKTPAVYRKSSQEK